MSLASESERERERPNETFIIIIYHSAATAVEDDKSSPLMEFKRLLLVAIDYGDDDKVAQRATTGS